MGHLNGRPLQRWKRGDGLTADALNGNFGILAERCETAMAQALMPDPANVRLEMRLGAALERIEALERLTSMHARQRNEREYAPLSHVGALIVMVNNLRADLERAVARIDEMHASLSGDHDDLDRRLLRLEQQPEAADKESFSALVGDFKRVALKEHMLLAQIIAFRHEAGILRELALGHDRNANRAQYAPLSTIGHLLQRIGEIEKRLP